MRTFWYLPLFKMCKAWHQYKDQGPQAVTFLNSPPMWVQTVCKDYLPCYELNDKLYSLAVYLSPLIIQHLIKLVQNNRGLTFLKPLDAFERETT